MKRRLGIAGWHLLLLFPALIHAQNPGALEDAAMERKKILQAADQMDVLTHKMESMEVELTELRQSVAKLEEENKALRDRIDTMKKESARERDALLSEVSKIIAEGSAASPKAAESSEGYEHVVQKGQSLWAIADAFQKQGVNVTVDDIRKANKLDKGSVLKVGEKLFIPKK